MHPNAYLQSLWRNEVLEQVFVAMSFDERFKPRFDEVIRPAIEDEPIAGKELTAYRVDISKSGDSILTEIVSGIAHSRLVLADVSVIDEGRYKETPIRNANVMYEVGVALACRNPSEVLLIRDDNKSFLFDVSTIPHIRIDFSQVDSAIATLRAAILDRINETELINDARVLKLLQTMGANELTILKSLAELAPDTGSPLTNRNTGNLSIATNLALTRLLQMGCVEPLGINKETGKLSFSATAFGRALVSASAKMLRPVMIINRE